MRSAVITIAMAIVSIFGLMSGNCTWANSDSDVSIVPQVGHSNRIGRISYSPNGKHLLSISGWPGGSIKLWDVTDGALIRHISGNNKDAIFSPDGMAILYCNNSTITLASLASGEVLRTYRNNETTLLAFSRDGKRFASAQLDGTVKIWRVDETSTNNVISSNGSYIIPALEFSPDGESIILTKIPRNISNILTSDEEPDKLDWDPPEFNIVNVENREVTFSEKGFYEAYLFNAAGSILITYEIDFRSLFKLWISFEELLMNMYDVDEMERAAMMAKGFANIFSEISSLGVVKIRNWKTREVIREIRGITAYALPQMALSPDGNHLMLAGGGLSREERHFSAFPDALYTTHNDPKKILKQFKARQKELFDYPLTEVNLQTGDTLTHSNKQSASAIAYSVNSGKLAIGLPSGSLDELDLVTKETKRFGISADDAMFSDISVQQETLIASRTAYSERLFGGSLKLSEYASSRIHTWDIKSMRFAHEVTSVDNIILDVSKNAGTALTIAKNSRFEHSPTLYLHDSSQGQKVRKFELSGIVLLARVSSDGSRFAVITANRESVSSSSAAGGAVSCHIAVFTGIGKKILEWVLPVKVCSQVTLMEFSPSNAHIILIFKNALSLSIEIAKKTPIWAYQIFRNIGSADFFAVSFSDDGKHVSLSDAECMTILDAKTGRPVKYFENAAISNLHTKYDLGEVCAGHTSNKYSVKSTDRLRTSPDIDSLFEMLGELIKQRFSGRLSKFNGVTWLNAGAKLAIISHETTIQIWDCRTWSIIRSFDAGPSEVYRIASHASSKRIITMHADHLIRVWGEDEKSYKLLVTLLSAGEEWVAITPDGFFDASKNGAKLLSVVRGLEHYSVIQVYEQLYRPELVRELLAGDPLGKYSDAKSKLNLKTILDSGRAPQLELLGHTEQSGDSIKLSVRIKDAGGGIGRKVVWRVNGKTQGDLISSDLQGAPSPGRYAVMRQELKVDSGGVNTVEVTAYNNQGLLSSLPLRITVDPFGVTTTPRPRLFVLAAGVDKYVAKSLELHYAVKDAEAFAEAMKLVGGALFSEVKIVTLRDGEVTKSGFAGAVNKLADEIKPTDVFVLFVGGHGRSIAGKYYFVQQDLDFEKGQTVERDAVSQDLWQQWLAKIPAQKTLLIYDTCESAAAEGLVRGDERERETAMEQLQHATGQNLIAAARQIAYEGYEGHGVLTYAILEAFQKAETTDREVERVDVDGLALHIGKRVPEITERLYHKRQEPIRKLTGNNFALGMKILSPTISFGGQCEVSDLQSKRGHFLNQPVMVRATPSEVSSVKQKLEKNTAITIKQCAGAWALIARDGEEIGYVPFKAMEQLH